MNEAFKHIEDELAKVDENRRLTIDGRIILNMTVKNDEQFLSPYSSTSTPIISAEVAEFIEHAAEAALPDERLTLKVSSDCIDEQEKNTYKNAIAEYYKQKYVSNEREYKRNKFIVAVLAVLGVIFLAAEMVFTSLIDSFVWSAVIDIVAWVFLWEAVDIGFFENRKLKLKKLRYLAFIDMKVEYTAV